MSKGRTPPELPSVTLPVSGYTIQVRPIGPLTINELSRQIRKEIPEPKPPLNTVKGLDEKEKQVENTADPDYLDALNDHAVAVNTELSARILKLIAIRSIATPVDADAVASLRADMIAVGVELPDDDREVFLKHILIANAEDMEAIQQCVIQGSQPTPEVVSSKLQDDFQDQVPGA